MNIKTFALGALIAIAGASSAANATNIDFNQVGSNWWIKGYSQSGYNMALFGGEGMATTTDPNSYWNGNGTGRMITWTNQGSSSGFTLTAADNQHFSLSSVDFANGYVAGNGNPTSLKVTGLTSLGSTVETSFDHASLGIYTYSFDNKWSDVISVSFLAIGSNNRAMFDNIMLGAASVSSTVPEPASVGLIGAGLIGVAAVRRRKQAAAA